VDLATDPALQGQGQQQGQQRASGEHERPGASPVNAFLNLFRGKSHSPAGSTAGASRSGSQQEGGQSCDIQEVPSSQGSSLAAVLQQLGLADSGASSRGGGNGGGGGSVTSRNGSQQAVGAAGVAGGVPPERRLRHSNEAEEFGSWKTAHDGSEGRLSGGSSWYSLGDSRQRVGSGQLASSASSSRAGQSPGLGQGPAPESPAHHQRSPRLSGVEANRRALSLQEEHLAGFLTSGKKDAARQQQQQQQQQAAVPRSPSLPSTSPSRP